MYVTNLKTDFFEYLSGKRIILLVHYDIDSICSCKILQALLKFKHILYTLAVVQGVDDLKTAFNENRSHSKFFIFINCGGTIDLVDLLEPDEALVFFVLDAHRPTDLANIYSPAQVRLLSRRDEDGQTPQVGDIYSEDEDSGAEEASNSDEGGSGDEQRSKRRRLDEEGIEKRREKRLWRDKRDKILFDYYQFTYYAKSSAVSMFNLSWEIGQDDKELLWFAIIGITEQYLLGKIEDSVYVLETGNLMSHANRLKNSSNNDQIALSSLKISYEEDLKLVLYRYWSVIDSLRYSMFTACKLKLWSHRGTTRLNELLAEMGFPLAQSSQSFQSMDLMLRKEFFGTLKALAPKYDLDDLIFTTFVLQFGYRNKFCAMDIVWSMLTILEYSPKEKSAPERFSLALDCLSRGNQTVLMAGIDNAKTIAQVVFKTVQKAIEMRQIVSAGPFVYYVIAEGFLDWYLFSHQQVLLLLANFILRAFVSMSRNKRASNLPLVVSAPKNIEAGTCILLGIPPLAENSPKSFFGKAFERAAEQINCDSSYDFFDTSYFEIYTRDRTRFFDALTSLLT